MPSFAFSAADIDIVRNLLPRDGVVCIACSAAAAFQWVDTSVFPNLKDGIAHGLQRPSNAGESRCGRCVAQSLTQDFQQRPSGLTQLLLPRVGECVFVS